MTYPKQPLSALEKDIHIVSTLIKVNSQNFTKPSLELKQHLAELKNGSEGQSLQQSSPQHRVPMADTQKDPA